jgi:hypothetical protein
MGADENSVKTKRNLQKPKDTKFYKNEYCHTENNYDNFNNDYFIRINKSRTLSISSHSTNQSDSDVYTLESLIYKFSKIQNQLIFPYNIICTIQINFKNSHKVNYFTGFLINSNTVITLASNINSENNNENIKDVIIYINSQNIIKIKKCNFLYHKEYNKLENDFVALLIEDNNILIEDKILIADIKNNNNLKDLNFILINSLNTDFDFDDKKLHETNLKYDNDLNKYYNKGNLNKILNQSKGSPIIYKNNNNLYIIGIFNREYKITLFNNKNLKFFENSINRSKRLRKKSVCNQINVYNYV